MRAERGRWGKVFWRLNQQNLLSNWNKVSEKESKIIPSFWHEISGAIHCVSFLSQKEKKSGKISVPETLGLGCL